MPPLFASLTVVGHRGAPRRAPENTIAAFRAAAADGATWVELDARRGADGSVLVHHDPVLRDGRPVVGLDAAAAAAAGVTTLAQVLQSLPSALGIDIEVKNLPGEPDHDEDQRIVEAVARDLGRYRRDRPVAVTSFNPLALEAARVVLPQVPRGLLFAGGMHLAGAADLVQELDVGLLCPHHSGDGVDAAGVAAVHEAGAQVLVWTVDDPVHARALAAAGVDAVCTNDVAAVVAALSTPP